MLVAHGDATSGYSLYVQDGRLHHTLNIGGQQTTVSSAPLPAGARTLGVDLEKAADGRTFTLLVDGAAAGSLKTTAGFATLISWSGPRHRP